MTFQEAVRTGFRKYAFFEGRASRSEYWWWVLFVVLVAIAASIIDAAGTLGLASALTGLGLLLPNIAVSVRRLHDIGKSGWNVLWGLVPIVGGLYLLFLYLHKGHLGANQYGPQPA
jgi:uncharacterized membrane protein YhaH (DUF805 family)